MKKKSLKTLSLALTAIMVLSSVNPAAVAVAAPAEDTAIVQQTETEDVTTEEVSEDTEAVIVEETTVEAETTTEVTTTEEATETITEEVGEEEPATEVEAVTEEIKAEADEVENADKREASSSAYLSTIMKDTNLLSLVVKAYNAKYSASLTTGTIKVSHLQAYDGDLVLSSTAVTSIDGLGLAQNATSIDITGLTKVTTIADNEFQGCKFTTFKMPSSITSIGDKAFYECDNMTAIYTGTLANTLPSNLRELGQQAFYSCDGLTAIKIPKLQDEGAVGAFQFCENLTTVTFGNNVTKIPVSMFQSAGTASESGMTVTFGSGLDKILGHAFSSAKFASGSVIDLSVCTKLTGIDSYAFKDAQNLTTVKLPASLTSLDIGSYAFAKTTLKCMGTSTSTNAVSMPAYIKSVGDGAFYGNTALTTVTLSSALTKISDYTFDGCTALKTVSNLNSTSNVTLIGDCAFRGTAITNTAFLTQMTKLTQIGRQLHDTAEDGSGEVEVETLPLGGLEISTKKGDVDTTDLSHKKYNKKPVGSDVFSNCPNLTTVTIPGSVKIICQRAFYSTEDDYCSVIEKITWSNGTAVAGTERRIYAEAFVGNYLLETMVLPQNTGESLVIGPSAFRGDFSLGSIGSASSTNNTLPNTVSSIGASAFYGCEALPEIHIQAYNGAAPDLDVQTFQHCFSLTKATLPSQIVEIPYRFFGGCPLTSFNFSDMVNLEKINENAFVGHQFTKIDLSACTKLKKLGGGSLAFLDRVDPDGYADKEDYCGKVLVTTDAQNATLTTVILPKSIPGTLIIGTGLFAFQDKFTTLYKYGSTVSGKVVFPSYLAKNDGRAEGVFYGSGVSNVSWAADTDAAAVNNRWTDVGPLMYAECENITDAKNVLPLYVEDIHRGAFVNSSVQSADLTKFTCLDAVGAGSANVEKGVFSGCSNLTTVKFPSTTTSEDGILLNVETFIGCTVLSSVDLGAVTELKDSVFQGCTALKSIALKNVKVVGKNAFTSCSNLATVDFGVVEEIKTLAFKECKALVLTSTPFPDTLTLIGSSAFIGATKLGKVTFGAGLEKIDGSAFKQSGVTAVDFSRAFALTEIGKNAFEDTQLTSFNISGTQVAIIPEKMLYDCDNLTSASFGEEIGYVSKNALAGCPKFKELKLYATTTVDEKLFYAKSSDSIISGQNNTSTQTNSVVIAVTLMTPEETIIPIDRTMNFPYYVGKEGKSNIQYITIKDTKAPTDTSVEKYLHVSAKTNDGYFKVENSSADYLVSDDYYEQLTIAPTAKMNNQTVDVFRVSGLKESGSRDLELRIFASMKFDSELSDVTINSNAFHADYKISIVDPQTVGMLYSDAKLSQPVELTSAMQVSKDDQAICYYYDLEDEIPNNAEQNNYNIVVESSDPSVLKVNSTSNKTTASDSCFVEATDASGKTSDSKKRFFVYPQKRGTATITVYPALYDETEREQHKTTYTFTVNSNIKSLTLAVPTEYKKKLNPGSSFCVFKEYTNYFGETCTVDKMSNYNKYTNTKIVYSSSDPDYVSVDQKGNVKILKADPQARTVKIMATYPGATGETTKTLSMKISYPEVKKNEQITDNLTGSEVTVTKVSTKDLEGEVEYTAPTNKNKTAVTVPDTVSINGIKYKVTTISAKAFKNNKKIKTLKIGMYVKTIGTEAFSGCTKLTKVTIGNNVETIGKKAFYNCKKLKTVTISATKSNLKTISDSAFQNCKKLSKITLPKKFKKLGAKAFYGCKSLKAITVKSTVLSSVGKDSLKGIHKKAVIKVPKKKLKAYKKLFKGKGQKSSVKIKKG